MVSKLAFSSNIKIEADISLDKWSNGLGFFLNILKDQNTDLKNTVKALEDKLVIATDKLAQTNVEKYTQQIEKLEKTVSELKENSDNTQDKIKADTVIFNELKTDKTKLEEKNTELKAKLQEVEEAKTVANRISTLVDGNIDKDVAIEKVKIFASLSDEQFAVIAKELIEAKKAQVFKQEAGAKDNDESNAKSNEKADEEKDESEVDANDKVLDNVETDDNDVDLTAVNDTDKDELTTLRGELVSAVSTYLKHADNSDEQEEKGDE